MGDMSKAFKKNFEYGEIGDDVLRAALQEIELIGRQMEAAMQKEIDEQGITSSGTMKDRVRSVMRLLKERIVLIVGPRVSYAWFVFAGTKPHPVSSKGRQNIREWVRLKLGISPGQTEEQEVTFWDDEAGNPVQFTATVNLLEQVTQGVIHKIEQEGTDSQDFLTPVLERFKGEIAPRLERRMAEAAGGD